MTTHANRIRRPSAIGPSSSGTVPPYVSIFWDDTRSLHIAVCELCCEGLESEREDQIEDWAHAHHCDPERAALLTETTRRAA